MRTHASPLKDKEGNVFLHVAVTNDVTEEVGKTQQLREYGESPSRGRSERAISRQYESQNSHSNERGARLVRPIARHTAKQGSTRIRRGGTYIRE